MLSEPVDHLPARSLATSDMLAHLVLVLPGLHDGRTVEPGDEAAERRQWVNIGITDYEPSDFLVHLFGVRGIRKPLDYFPDLARAPAFGFGCWRRRGFRTILPEHAQQHFIEIRIDAVRVSRRIAAQDVLTPSTHCTASHLSLKLVG